VVEGESEQEALAHHAALWFDPVTKQRYDLRADTPAEEVRHRLVQSRRDTAQTVKESCRKFRYEVAAIKDLHGEAVRCVDGTLAPAAALGRPLVELLCGDYIGIFVVGQARSGKGRLCEYISSQFGLEYFAASTVLQSAISSGSILGRQASEHQEQTRKPIPPAMMAQLLAVRLGGQVQQMESATTGGSGSTSYDERVRSVQQVQAGMRGWHARKQAFQMSVHRETDRALPLVPSGMRRPSFKDHECSWVFNGFPETVDEANQLDAVGFRPLLVLVLDEQMLPEIRNVCLMSLIHWVPDNLRFEESLKEKDHLLSVPGARISIIGADSARRSELCAYLRTNYDTESIVRNPREHPALVAQIVQDILSKPHPGTVSVQADNLSSVVQLVTEHTFEGSESGWVIDGYPACQPEAMLLTQLRVQPDVILVVEPEVSDLETEYMWLYDSTSHTTFLSPDKGQLVAEVEARLVPRQTERADCVAKRLASHKARLSELVSFYGQQVVRQVRSIEAAHAAVSPGTWCVSVLGPASKLKRQICAEVAEANHLRLLDRGAMSRHVRCAQREAYINPRTRDVKGELMIRSLVKLVGLPPVSAMLDGKWMLDNLPENMMQAKMLSKRGITPTLILVRHVADEELFVQCKVDQKLSELGCTASDDAIQMIQTQLIRHQMVVEIQTQLAEHREKTAALKAWYGEAVMLQMELTNYTDKPTQDEVLSQLQPVLQLLQQPDTTVMVVAAVRTCKASILSTLKKHFALEAVTLPVLLHNASQTLTGAQANQDILSSGIVTDELVVRLVYEKMRGCVEASRSNSPAPAVLEVADVNRVEVLAGLRGELQQHLADAARKAEASEQMKQHILVVAEQRESEVIQQSLRQQLLVNAKKRAKHRDAAIVMQQQIVANNELRADEQLQGQAAANSADDEAGVADLRLEIMKQVQKRSGSSPNVQQVENYEIGKLEMKNKIIMDVRAKIMTRVNKQADEEHTESLPASEPNAADAEQEQIDVAVATLTKEIKRSVSQRAVAAAQAIADTEIAEQNMLAQSVRQQCLDRTLKRADEEAAAAQMAQSVRQQCLDRTLKRADEEAAAEMAEKQQAVSITNNMKHEIMTSVMQRTEAQRMAENILLNIEERAKQADAAQEMASQIRNNIDERAEQKASQQIDVKHLILEHAKDRADAAHQEQASDAMADQIMRNIEQRARQEEMAAGVRHEILHRVLGPDPEAVSSVAPAAETAAVISVAPAVEEAAVSSVAPAEQEPVKVRYLWDGFGATAAQLQLLRQVGIEPALVLAQMVPEEHVVQSCSVDRAQFLHQMDAHLETVGLLEHDFRASVVHMNGCTAPELSIDQQVDRELRELDGHVLVLGVAGSGRGKTGEYVAAKYGFTQLNPAAAMHQVMRDQTNPLGSSLRETLKLGQSPTDELMGALLLCCMGYDVPPSMWQKAPQTAIQQHAVPPVQMPPLQNSLQNAPRQLCESARGSSWLLDGYPFTSAQLECLRDVAIVPTVLLLVHDTLESSLQRAESRMVDPVSRRVYDIKSSPPTDPDLLARLVKRKSDQPSCVEARLARSLVQHSMLRDAWPAAQVHELDGTQDLRVISRATLQLLNSSTRPFHLMISGACSLHQHQLCSVLISQLGLLNLNPSEVVKQAIAHRTALGAAAKQQIAGGQPVSDEAIAALFVEAIERANQRPDGRPPEVAPPVAPAVAASPPLSPQQPAALSPQQPAAEHKQLDASVADLEAGAEQLVRNAGFREAIARLEVAESLLEGAPAASEWADRLRLRRHQIEAKLQEQQHGFNLMKEASLLHKSGMLEAAAGRYSQAEAHLLTAGDAAAAMKATEAQTEILSKISTRSKASELILEGRALLDSQQYTEAVQKFATAQAICIASTDPQGAAEAAAERGSAEQASATLVKAQQLSVDASTLFNISDYSKAADSYREAEALFLSLGKKARAKIAAQGYSAAIGLAGKSSGSSAPEGKSSSLTDSTAAQQVELIGKSSSGGQLAVSDLLTSAVVHTPAQPMHGPVTPRELAAMARRQRQKKAAQLEVDTALHTARSWHAGDDEMKAAAAGGSQSPAHTQPASRPRSPPVTTSAQPPETHSGSYADTVNGGADSSALIHSNPALTAQLEDEKQKSSWLEKQLRRAQETARQHEETARHHEERARLAEDTVRGLTSQPTSSCPSPEPQQPQQAPAQAQQPQAPAQAARLASDWYSSTDNNTLADIIDGTSAINQVVNQHQPFQPPTEPGGGHGALQLPSVSGLLHAASGRKVYVSPRSWAQPRTNHRPRSAPVNQPDHPHTFVPPAQHQLHQERTKSDLSAPTQSGDMRRPLGYSSRVLARCERLQQVYEKYGCSSAQAVALSRPGAKAPAAAREARGSAGQPRRPNSASLRSQDASGHLPLFSKRSTTAKRPSSAALRPKPRGANLVAISPRTRRLSSPGRKSRQSTNSP